MEKQITITNLDDFARLIGLPKALLTRYIFQADSYYKIFKRRKKSGRGYRRISAPSRELKGIQKWISLFILNQIALESAAKGFIAGLSIKDNAYPHMGKDFVCNLDIKDFFPTVTAKRVTAIFKSFGYSKPVAGSLARLTTYKGKLPQGAPSSPQLANIVLRRLDRRITKFCELRGWQYTRYCDDLSISGKKDISERELATITSIVESEGFKINSAKTRIKRRNARQEVTGLVVNEKQNIPRLKRKNLRAMFHQALLFPEKFQARIDELQGHLSHLRFVRPDDAAAIERYQRSIERVRSFQPSSIKSK